jgi:hypothetical protein
LPPSMESPWEAGLSFVWAGKFHNYRKSEIEECIFLREEEWFSRAQFLTDDPFFGIIVT